MKKIVATIQRFFLLIVITFTSIVLHGNITHAATTRVLGLLPNVQTDTFIDFADPTVKSICVTNWDTNGDGELSIDEAAVVTSLGTVFKKKDITSFNELQYFIGLQSINEGAFANCKKIQEITLPVNVESLEKEAFLYCKSLVSLHFPEKVASIGQNALSGCTAMTSITVDEDNTAFCDIDGVLFTKDGKTLWQYPAAKATTYTVPEGTEAIDRDAFFQANVTSVTLPSTLKELSYDAFGFCKQLTEMNLPEGIKTIDDYLFDNCSALTTIHFPSTVTSIGKSIGHNCNAIIDVYCAMKEPFAIDDNNFTSTVYTNATLHVPAGTKEKYSSIDGWKNFSIIESEDTLGNINSCALAVETMSIRAGNSADLSIGLTIDHDELYNGFQFDITLPEGFTLAKNGNKYAYTLADRYTDDMQVSFNELGGNQWRVMVYSLTNAMVKGLDGKAISLSITANRNIADDGYSGSISNIRLSRTDGKSVPVPEVTFNIQIIPPLYCEVDSLHTGQTSDLSIYLSIDSDNLYNGYQFDITLPEGVTLAKNDITYSYTLADRYTDDMQVSFNELGENQWRVMVYSLTNAMLKGLEGKIITLTIAANEDIIEGNYTGSVTNFRLSRIDGNSIHLPDGEFNIQVVNDSRYLMGDANHDGVVDISDVMLTVYKALNKAVYDFHMEEADINHDDIIDIVDVMSIVNITLGKTVVGLPAHYIEDHLTHLLIKNNNKGWQESGGDMIR